MTILDNTWRDKPKAFAVFLRRPSSLRQQRVQATFFVTSTGDLILVVFPSIQGRKSSLSFKRESLDILKFSLHSSEMTTSFTKLSHHALVLPGLVQNRRSLQGLYRCCARWGPSDSSKIRKLLLSRRRIKYMLQIAIFNSKQAIRVDIIDNNTAILSSSAMLDF